LKRDLIIEVDYHGRTVVGRIDNSVNAPNLERVRNFLLDYCDEPMGKIEDLDVTPDQFKTSIKIRCLVRTLGQKTTSGEENREDPKRPGCEPR
jgi:hypothetical protein